MTTSVDVAECELDAGFRDAFTVLHDAATTEADLHEAGRLGFNMLVGWQVDTYVGAAANRVPDPKVAGLVIGGLPRTGTTALHTLLCEALPYRSLSVPEALRPAALDGKEVADYALMRVEGLRAMSPEFFGIHPIEVDGTEECTPLLEATLRCLQFPIMARMPSYLRWLLGTDFTAVYHHWASELGRLDPYAAWLLKSPLHFIAYPALLGYLDGFVVELERDTVEWFVSFINLVFYARRLLSNPLPSAVALEWLAVLPAMVAQAEMAAAANCDRFVRVSQRELAADPTRVVDRLCFEASLERRTGWRAAVERAAAETGPSALPLTLRDLGVDERQVRSAFYGTNALLT